MAERLLGLVTGTGLYDLGLEDPERVALETPHGRAELTLGRLGGRPVAHAARHGAGHERLSHQVTPRATVSALAQLGAAAAIATTVCGAVDPSLDLGSLVVFDDLHFPGNRLPDGSLCTLFTDASAPGRGHWMFEQPFAAGARRAALAGACAAAESVRDGGVYGHVDGPRLNSRTEIAALAAVGVSCVSQTGGPETVLFGEAGIPFALLGYVTDHANGVAAPTPPEVLGHLLGQSAGVLARALGAAAAALQDPGPPAGLVFRL